MKGVVGTFGRDKRILARDVWNEPDSINEDTIYRSRRAQGDKAERVLELLPKVFAWAREAGAQQPLTSGVWDDWTSPENIGPMRKTQLAESDIVSFHGYEKPENFEERIISLLPYGRPILCTEYMARSRSSTFDNTLPIAKKYGVAAINWGLVAGKTQTYLPWDSWGKPYIDREPTVWFHEVFRPDGKPYRQEETELIRRLTSRSGS